MHQINDIISKKIIVRDDEYLDESGLPHCKNCKTLRVWVSPDKKCVWRCLCECQVNAAYEKSLKEKKQAEERELEEN